MDRLCSWPLFSMLPAVYIEFSSPRTLLYHEIIFSVQLLLPAAQDSLPHQQLTIKPSTVLSQENKHNSSGTTQSLPKVKAIFQHQQACKIKSDQVFLVPYALVMSSSRQQPRPYKHDSTKKVFTILTHVHANTHAYSEE